MELKYNTHFVLAVYAGPANDNYKILKIAHITDVVMAVRFYTPTIDGGEFISEIMINAPCLYDLLISYFGSYIQKIHMHFAINEFRSTYVNMTKDMFFESIHAIYAFITNIANITPVESLDSNGLLVECKKFTIKYEYPYYLLDFNNIRFYMRYEGLTASFLYDLNSHSSKIRVTFDTISFYETILSMVVRPSDENYGQINDVLKFMRGYMHISQTDIEHQLNVSNWDAYYLISFKIDGRKISVKLSATADKFFIININDKLIFLLPQEAVKSFLASYLYNTREMKVYICTNSNKTNIYLINDLKDRKDIINMISNTNKISLNVPITDQLIIYNDNFIIAYNQNEYVVKVKYWPYYLRMNENGISYDVLKYGSQNPDIYIKFNDSVIYKVNMWEAFQMPRRDISDLLVLIRGVVNINKT